MTNSDKVEKVRKLSNTIELIENVLKRIKKQKKICLTKENDYKVFSISKLLQNFFSVFQRELENVITPENYDLEVLILVESFYENKKRELEHELITL